MARAWLFIFVSDLMRSVFPFNRSICVCRILECSVNAFRFIAIELYRENSHLVYHGEMEKVLFFFFTIGTPIKLRVPIFHFLFSIVVAVVDVDIFLFSVGCRYPIFSEPVFLLSHFFFGFIFA